MPEMTFTVRWPDGQVQECYSPSLVMHDHLVVGQQYTVDEFTSEARLSVRTTMAAMLGVPLTNVELVVTPGSINVEARITPTFDAPVDVISTLAHTAMEAAAEGAGVVATAMSAPAIVTVLMDAKLLPDLLLGDSLGLESPDDDEPAHGLNPTVIGILAAALIAALIAIAVLVVRKNRRPRTTVNTIAVPVGVSVVSSTAGADSTTAPSYGQTRAMVKPVGAPGEVELQPETNLKDEELVVAI